jgi:hypothetical protein
MMHVVLINRVECDSIGKRHLIESVKADDNIKIN